MIDPTELISYLYCTNQLDDSFNFKNYDTYKCPVCKTELLIYEGNRFYCPTCKTITEYAVRRKIENKRLTLEQKMRINNN